MFVNGSPTNSKLLNKLKKEKGKKGGGVSIIHIEWTRVS